MRETRLDIRELLAGGFTIGLGASAIWIAQDYPFGELRRMGPGYFPTSLGWILIGLGAVIATGGFLRGGVQPRPEWRNLIGVLAAILAFALVVERFGLIAAIVALVFISSAADRSTTYRGTAILTVCLVLMAVGIFVEGLGIPFRIWQWPY
ncbi:tripartite tricarboxylate transporter TctB family protein [Elioraea sp.]|uniref:tripartite tricarboxylate transporter TctB family protein n=1 Tax=Elioraea sp. TaxID=2185103 RepID=UPI003F72CC9A